MYFKFTNAEDKLMTLNPILVKQLCHSVINDWEPKFDFLSDNFKLPLTKEEFFDTNFYTLGNKTINDYLRVLTNGSRYIYATFKRRAEILLSNHLIPAINFNLIDNLTFRNALHRIDTSSSKDFSTFIDSNAYFDSELWCDFLLDKQAIIGIQSADVYQIFEFQTYASDIIKLFGLLPYRAEISQKEDTLLIYCVDSNNISMVYSIIVTHPLCSRFV